MIITANKDITVEKSLMLTKDAFIVAKIYSNLKWFFIEYI